MRWLWLQKTQLDQPWAQMGIQVHPNILAMFAASVISIVGDEKKKTCFWTDRWLHGQPIQELAPALVALVPKRVLNMRTVHDASTDLQWVDGMQGSLPVQAFFKYFLIWNILQET